jgi:hypothetical protein
MLSCASVEMTLLELRRLRRETQLEAIVAIGKQRGCLAPVLNIRAGVGVDFAIKNDFFESWAYPFHCFLLLISAA